MAQAAFPEPTALNVLEIGDGGKPNPGAYTLDKPHPAYGKDPNILNQLGHTVYPKWVYPQGNANPGILVKNEKEEHEVMGTEAKQEDKPKGAW